jgi:putative inorganic carbon (hco3(-)) transporter
MGIALTIAYIFLTILSPEQFGPSWANYHVLQYLAGLIFLASLPNILNHKYFTSSIQTRLLLAFIVAIGVSQIANGWLGGAINSWLRFMPSAALFFFIAANVTTARRLKIVSLALAGSCLFVAVEALCAYYWGFNQEMFVLQVPIYAQDEIVGQLLRIRGGGFLNDPNDFAQILEIALALLFIAWRQGRVISNSLFVLAPAAILLWATYLTHSRGALLGLVVLGLAVALKKLGTTWSLALASALAVAMLALDFTGGRGISASEGTDRLQAWATGLELFKHAPIFGVGFGSFTDFNAITAHNSFVLPLAELGLVGATTWVGLLVTTIMGLNRLIPRPEVSEVSGVPVGDHNIISDLHNGEHEAEALHSSTGSSVVSFQDQFIDYGGNELLAERDLVQVTPMEDESSIIKDVEYEGNEASALPFSGGGLSIGEIDEVKSQAAINSFHQRIVPETWLTIIRLALIAFMTTSWFLSRTYSPTTYLVLGIAAAAIGLERSDTETQDRRWISVTLGVEGLLIIFVYLLVRLRH